VEGSVLEWIFIIMNFCFKRIKVPFKESIIGTVHFTPRKTVLRVISSSILANCNELQRSTSVRGKRSYVDREMTELKAA